LLKNSNNWCPEVYRGIFVDRHNDDQLFVAPCCQAHGGLESSADFDFAKSKTLNNIREKFSRGERAEECRLCWTMEDLGQKSRRQSSIEFFGVDPSEEVVLETIDHSSTWACNLSCVMCGPKISSTWAKELNLNKKDLATLGRSFQSRNNILDQLDLSNVRRVHFNGGEPFLNDDQVNLIQRLDKTNQFHDMFISYNSNGTLWPSDSMIKLWERSKLVKVFFSIDATETAFEYIRYPANWQQTQQNLLRMRDELPSNVVFGFNVSVGGHNVLELSKVIDWFNANLKINREGDSSDFCIQFVTNFDMRLLSDRVKQAALKILQNYPEATTVCNYLDTGHEGETHWLQELDNIDQRRGTNWRQSLQLGKYY